VLLALWIAWFATWRDRTSVLLIGAACATAALALSPVMIGFARIHSYYGFSRSYREILSFSGDLTSLVTASPLLSLWG
jgi:hypothetical protein